MNKHQLTNFYYDMEKNLTHNRINGNYKNVENSSNLIKNKSVSVFNKENKILDWRFANKITMN